MNYAVTGATGSFGALAIKHLLDFKVPASSIIALARNQGKTTDLAKKGVGVRIADYDDPSSLEKALQGVDRLLLVSASEVGKRAQQHENVILAAKKAGVKLLVYTSISHADISVSPLAPEHVATEAIIKKAGLSSVILRNNWYTENYANDLKQARTTGTIEAAAGDGKVASATRSEYAEAAARVLMGSGHAGKIYELAGPPWSYADFARLAAELLGKPVAYKALSAQQRTQSLLAAGLPEGAAGFVTALDQSIAAGALAKPSGDLESLIGRKPLSLNAGLKTLL